MRRLTLLAVLVAACGGLASTASAHATHHARRHGAHAIGHARQHAAASVALPCDAYAAGGTPCVAAYSTIRALSARYRGPLYQVTRASDGRTLAIRPLVTGYADAAAQDRFCRATTCTITELYDQSGEHNDLAVAPGGGENPVPDVAASATALPVTVAGHRAYGVLIDPGVGYRDDTTHGVAVDGGAEGMYMVTSSDHVNDGCCFDFGNAETSNDDTGNGHMDAVNFSTRCVRFSPCYGDGPWVQADLENGLFQSDEGFSKNALNTGLHDPFVTALLKNNGQDYWALKVGDAQTGGLTTNWAGNLPTIQGGGYMPMQQEGAIVLGVGGDNSNAGSGEFFEGVMTAGLPTDTADDEVQASIVAARYGERG